MSNALTFKQIADMSDAYDGEVETINESRKEMWTEVRQVYTPKDVAALKEAIRFRRKHRKDPEAVEEHSARVEEILGEISETEPPHARGARARATIRLTSQAPSHNPETGEITEAETRREELQGATCDDAGAVGRNAAPALSDDEYLGPIPVGLRRAS